MRLVVVRENGMGRGATEGDRLAYAFSTDPLQQLILDGTRHMAYGLQRRSAVSRLMGGADPDDMLRIVPDAWRESLPPEAVQSLGCVTPDALDGGRIEQARRHPWFVVSDGRYAAHVNGTLLEQLLGDEEADVLAVTATPQLLAYQERVRLTQHGELVGYRRLYRDAVQPIPLPEKWPHHLLIRSRHADAFLADGLFRDFASVIEACHARHLRVRAVAVAGCAADVATPEGWLRLSKTLLHDARSFPTGAQGAQGRTQQIASDARLMGPILLGEDVRVEPGAVLIGPSILCRGSAVRRNAVVDSSVVGAHAVVESEQTLRRVFIDAVHEPATAVSLADVPNADEPQPTYTGGDSVFRTWSRISYAGGFKRIVDVVVAAVVLLLFVPIIPVMALAIKLNSPGPVFFKDKRQGLHGRLFDCFKFRTMRVGAADIQDKLRFVSEVDGPQFKMADDPRISTVGRFLRETYLDEIPQFFNVLCGDMSIVGPRPSPEAENTLCPSWRDARLSVRPGITGLWQVNRTRRPFKDFQEWIYYDTEYVRKLSPRIDLWICWRTFMKMIENFVHQF